MYGLRSLCVARVGGALICIVEYMPSTELWRERKLAMEYVAVLKPKCPLAAEPVCMQCSAHTTPVAGVIIPEEISDGSIARSLPGVAPIRWDEEPTNSPPAER